MANKHRGEVDICLEGKVYPLCLTLAALAELEDRLGLDNIGALAGRFANGKVKSRDLMVILGVALRAGGASLSDEEAAAMQCEGGAMGITKALVELIGLTFSPPDSGETNGPGHKETASANPL